MIITPTRVLRGKDGVRENFVQLLGDVPQVAWEIRNTVYEATRCCWSGGAEGGGNRVDDGVDMFIFRDGMIRL